MSENSSAPAAQAAEESNPPLQPEAALALLWALSFKLSDDTQKAAIGDYAKQNFDSILQSTDATGQKYVRQVLFELTSSLRNLSYRRDGFKQQMELNNSVLQQQIKTYNSMASISISSATSLIPRLTLTLGGISLSDAIASIVNAYLPTGAKVSGIEVFLVGAVGGYILAEILLRLYASIQIPRVMKKAHHLSHVAWNRYIRECRESARNFLIFATRLRELVYPQLGTWDKRRAFVGNVEEDVKRLIDGAIDDVVERHTPIIHSDATLSPKLSRSRGSSRHELLLHAGDSVVLSYSTLVGRINCYLLSEKEFEEWTKKRTKAATMYSEEGVSAGGTTYYVTHEGKYFLVFQNPSYIRPRTVTFGWQVSKDSIRQFCSQV